MQLLPCAQAGYAHPVLNPLLAQRRKLCSCGYAALLEHLAVSATYAPYIVDRVVAEHFCNVFIALHKAGAVELGVLFAQLCSNLCKGFGVGHANANRDACVAPYGACKLLAKLFQLLCRMSVEHKESFVNGVYLNLFNVLFQGCHHAL